MKADELLARLKMDASVRPLRNRPTEALSVEDMLEICLEWLDNVSRSDPDAYFDAMPNDVPGVSAMIGRLLNIQTQNV